MQELRGMPVVKQIAADAAVQVEELKKKGIEPKLAVVRVGEREDDLSYERGLLKRFEAVGASVESVVFPVDVTQEELEAVFLDYYRNGNAYLNNYQWQEIPGFSDWEEPIQDDRPPARTLREKIRRLFGL